MIKKVFTLFAKFARKNGVRVAKYESTSTTAETFNTYEHFLFISKLLPTTNDGGGGGGVYLIWFWHRQKF
jgi:hypothetical protein